MHSPLVTQQRCVCVCVYVPVQMTVRTTFSLQPAEWGHVSLQNVPHPDQWGTSRSRWYRKWKNPIPSKMQWVLPWIIPHSSTKLNAIQERSLSLREQGLFTLSLELLLTALVNEVSVIHERVPLHQTKQQLFFHQTTSWHSSVQHLDLSV